MRLVAKSGNAALAHTDIVLPVSDEMDCRACHASGSGPAAMPSAGWVNITNDVQRDYRLNILRLHDEKTGSTLSSNQPVLCARCHLSEALPGSGKPGIPALTLSMHDFHAHVVDPTNGLILDASDNRSACYRCHPGSTTRCLRGAMGSAVAADGTMAMQCQSCHGSMSLVGAASRTGWLDEPNCQACHNGGQRYTSVFDSSGHMRVPADATFATNPDTPAAGLSLYRFSKGHGGLTCEACHGSTHAEFPSSHDNDNITSVQHQGHVGMLVECNACHGSMPSTVNGGPHGMHPVGQTWISQHSNIGEGGGGAAQCQACHGADYRGTFLSRAQADRAISGFGTKTFWRGFQIGCYTCHNGPGSDNGNNNHPPVASNGSVSTPTNTPVAIALHATDADGNALTLRIVSQAKHGTVGLAGTAATYYPEAGFVGSDSFTFAARDGQTDSNLGKVLVGVGMAAPPSDFAGHWVDLAQICKKKCTLKGHFAIQNSGPTNEPAGVLAVYPSNDAILDGSDTLLKQYRVGSICGGKSVNRNIKINLPAGTSTSGQYVIAFVDADDSVPDVDDSDNVAAYGPMP